MCRNERRGIWKLYIGRRIRGDIQKFNERLNSKISKITLDNIHIVSYTIITSWN